MTAVVPGREERASLSEKAAARDRGRGVVIVGGAHGTIALARSLRGFDIPVWHITDDSPLPGFSRHIHRTLKWPGPLDPYAAEILARLAKENGLEGYVLIASGDAEVKLISQAYERLSAVYRLVTQPWRELSVACDKREAYARAKEIGLFIPEIHAITSVEQAAAADLVYPVVLKPSMRIGRNPFTIEKAWRADDREMFLALYESAAGYVGPENVVVQEMVPGCGETQLSYAALWDNGVPVAELTARRTRQYPIEFSYTSTFVETVDAPDVLDAGRRFCASIRLNGLVEIEFKRDPRNGKLKLLDVNPRPWTWFGLAEASGVDFGPLLWAKADGEIVPTSGKPQAGIGWMYTSRDIVAAAQMIRRGWLSPRAYFASIFKVRSWAAFALTDPLPAIVDAPLVIFRILTRRIFVRR